MFLYAKSHEFVFHNSIYCNKGRGFEIYIVAIYSETLKDDLKRIEPKDYIKIINKLVDNNYKMIEITKIDINPWSKIQNILIDFNDNIIDCMIFAILSNTEDHLITKLNIGSSKNEDIINVDCTETGLHFR